MHSVLARANLFACILVGAVGCSESSETSGPSASPASEPRPTAPGPAASAATQAPLPSHDDSFPGGCDAYLKANRQAIASAGASCTATEQTLFAKDPTGQCLSCLFQSGCLDDANEDTGQECEDLSGAAAQAQCLVALRCDIGSSPSKSPAPGAGLAVNAYCGVGVPVTTKCQNEGPAGPCVPQIAAGFPAGFSPTQIVNNFAVRKHPAGMSNAIVACGVSAAQTKGGAGCGKCLR
jgi:hypothetical protein